MKTIKHFSIIALAVAALAGCVTTGQYPAQPVVDARAAGSMSETMLAVIVDVRAIQIKNAQQPRPQPMLFGSGQPATVPGFEIVVKVRDGKQEKLQTIIQQAAPGEAFAVGQTVRLTRSSAGWYASPIGGQQPQAAPVVAQPQQSSIGGFFGKVFGDPAQQDKPAEK